MKGTEYVKLILYVYPKLGAIADGVDAGAEVKAKLSFRSFDDTLALAEQIAEELWLAENLRELQELTEDFVASLNDEERFLLEYKYFRRKKKVAASPFAKMSCSERNYFRKQAVLFQRACAFFARHNLTEEEFLKRFGAFPEFMRALKAFREGKESQLIKRRKQRGVSFQKSDASCAS